jgi:lipopolysaccharide export system permease protein
MPLIDRYILRQVGETFLLGLGLFTAIVLLPHVFFLSRLASETQVTLRTNLQLLVLRIPFLVGTYSLPFATLFAVLLAFGRLSDRNEVTALRTSGWSLARVAAPVVAAGVAVTLINLTINEFVAPLTETRYRNTISDVVRGPSRQIQRDVLFRERVDDLDSVFYTRELDPQSGTMSGVVINQFRDDTTLLRVIEARAARYEEGGWWVLQGGTIYLVRTGVQSTFDEIRVRMKRAPRQIAPPRRDPYEMTIRELRQQIAALGAAGEGALRHMVALHSKMALPTSSMIFALLAVPLGLRPHRSGRSIGFGLTVVVLLCYYVMISITLTLGESGRIAPFWAAWTPNLLVAATGSYLLWRSR